MAIWAKEKIREEICPRCDQHLKILNIAQKGARLSRAEEIRLQWRDDRILEKRERLLGVHFHSDPSYEHDGLIYNNRAKLGDLAICVSCFHLFKVGLGVQIKGSIAEAPVFRTEKI